MTLCRTLAEIEAAGAETGRRMPPLTQEQADQAAAILAPYLAQITTAKSDKG